MTFLDLITAFKYGREVTIANITGIIISLEREDGSGHCYNVILRPTKVPAWIHNSGNPVKGFIRVED